jgi:hypothetical protein
MINTRVSNHIATSGFVGVTIGSTEMHVAWIICLISLMISLGFALARFMPRFEK